VHGSIDISSAMGRAYVHMAALFAEFERGMIGERTKAGMPEKTSRRSPSRPPHCPAGPGDRAGLRRTRSGPFLSRHCARPDQRRYTNRHRQCRLPGVIGAVRAQCQSDSNPWQPECVMLIVD